MRLSKKGAGTVTAADIEAPADLEILNPELEIANLSDRGPARDHADDRPRPRLRPGRDQPRAGAHDRRHPDRLDLLAGPPRLVRRRGRPRRAAHRLRQAPPRRHDRRLDRPEGRDRAGRRDPDPPARDLHRHREDRGLRRGGASPRRAGAEPSLAHGMENFPIEELELGVRSYNCLKRVGIETIGDLVTKTENELAAIPNFGKKSIEEVKETLAHARPEPPRRGRRVGSSMRHQRSGKKLGRDSAHRKALYANLAGALIEHGRIKTTEAKAKAVKPIAEQMITLGRRGDLHARRQALAFLRSQDVVHKLFADVGAALRRAARRLLADREARPARGRRRRDGVPRARRLRARGVGRTRRHVAHACRSRRRVRRARGARRRAPARLLRPRPAVERPRRRRRAPPRESPRSCSGSGTPDAATCKSARRR